MDRFRNFLTSPVRTGLAPVRIGTLKTLSSFAKRTTHAA
jgi:hypothetical protein